MYELCARCARFAGVGPVAIQPVSSSPSHSQIGCRTRTRGRFDASTVAAVHQTMLWAISTKAGATSSKRFTARILRTERRVDRTDSVRLVNRAALSLGLLLASVAWAGVAAVGHNM